MMERWIPFLLVNIVSIWALFMRFSNEMAQYLCLIALAGFNFLYFPLFDRLKFDKFKFALSKDGLDIVFDQVAKGFVDTIDEIDYEGSGVPVKKDEIKNLLSQASSIENLAERVSLLTYKYTLEAVKAKKQVKKVNDFPTDKENIFRTRKISDELAEIFKER